MLLIVTLQLLFSLSAFARTTGPLGSSGQAQQADNCTLLPRGRGLDDSGAIATIFERCGKDGGVVRFPPPYVYTIGSRLETYVSNATIELEGTFQFTPNLTYWLNNRLGRSSKNVSASDIRFTQLLLFSVSQSTSNDKRLHGVSTAKTLCSRAEKSARAPSTGMVKCGILTPKVGVTRPAAP